jgi:hypothetical protein
LFSVPAATARGTGASGHILPVATASHWAGYVVRAGGRAFSAVSGSWVQPRIVCNRAESSAAFWVGLGGAERTSRALEQLGTLAGCTAAGSPWYSAWYQLFPAPPVDIPLAIRPGDLVSARLSLRGSTVNLEFGNRSTGASFATKTSPPAVETGSVEWIAEAPAMCLTRDCALGHLATFTRVVFVDARARAETLRGSVVAGVWTTQPIQMRAISGRPPVVPTSLSRGGLSFAVQQLAAPTH